MSAERRYHAVDPEHRLVARGLEREWEQRLQELAAAEAASPRTNNADRAGPRGVSPEERVLIERLGTGSRACSSAACNSSSAVRNSPTA